MRKKTAAANVPAKSPIDDVFSLSAADRDALLEQLEISELPKSPEEGKALYEELYPEVEKNIVKFWETGQRLAEIKRKGLWLPQISGCKGADTFTDWINATFHGKVRPFQILTATTVRGLLKDGLGIKNADDIWTCEAQYYDLRKAKSLVDINGDLTIEGMELKEKLKGLKTGKDNADAVKAKVRDIVVELTAPERAEPDDDDIAKIIDSINEETLKNRLQKVIDAYREKLGDDVFKKRNKEIRERFWSALDALKNAKPKDALRFDTKAASKDEE